MHSNMAAPTAKRAKIRPHAMLQRVCNEDVVLFVAFVAIYALIAYYFAIVLQMYHNDTIARTALGYFVMYGRNPHLASIGFVWTPLVSLMQLPLFPVLTSIGQPVLAGPVLGVLLGAATLPILNETGKALRVNRAFRLPVVVLYGLHPTILLYAAIGMSETAFFLFMAASMHYLLRWACYHRNDGSLVLCGLSAAMAFWCRYEAAPLLAGLVLAILASVLSSTYQDPRLLRHYLEATCLTVIVPVAYSIALWAFFNWLIMGDPLFFWSGQYTNQAYTEQFRTGDNLLYHDLPASLIYSAYRAALQFPIFPFLVALLVTLSLHQRSLRPTLPIYVPLALFLFHVYQNYSGASYGWYRFFTYVVIGSIPVVFWLVSPFTDIASWRRAMQWIVIGSMLLSFFTTTIGMYNPSTGKEEAPFMDNIGVSPSALGGTQRAYSETKAREVADFIDENCLDGPVLVDSFQGFSIILFSRHPDKFVKTQDVDFERIVHNPPAYGIQWLLVPRPEDYLLEHELILKTYPGIWENGVPWATLARDFGGWKLFRVTSSIR